MGSGQRIFNVNERKLRRLFPRASESFIKRNSYGAGDTGSANQSEQMDREEVCQTQRSKEMGKEYRLSHVEISFHAKHGKSLDQDNRRYIAKPILDALVNLGAAPDDKDITSEVTQTKARMDEDNPNV